MVYRDWGFQKQGAPFWRLPMVRSLAYWCLEVLGFVGAGAWAFRNCGLEH